MFHNSLEWTWRSGCGKRRKSASAAASLRSSGFRLLTSSCARMWTASLVLSTSIEKKKWRHEEAQSPSGALEEELSFSKPYRHDSGCTLTARHPFVQRQPHSMSDRRITELQPGFNGSVSMFRRICLSLFLLVFFFLALKIPAAQAQQEFSHVEIGAQF